MLHFNRIGFLNVKCLQCDSQVAQKVTDRSTRTAHHVRYITGANRETFLTVQIETRAAVHNCEAMAKVKGVGESRSE